MEYPMLYRQRAPMGRIHSKAAVEEFMWIGWCKCEQSEQTVRQSLQGCAKCNKFMRINEGKAPAPAPSTEEKLQSQTTHDKFKVIIHVCVVQQQAMQAIL